MRGRDMKTRLRSSRMLGFLGVTAIASILMLGIVNNAYAACVGGAPNGVKDPTEECDDGNVNNADACTTGCNNAVCGDGFQWTQQGGTEQCDQGNSLCIGGHASTSGDICGTAATCKGVCAGGTNPGGPCKTATQAVDCPLSTCTDGATCGTGVNNDNFTADQCRTNCKRASCGDGVNDGAVGVGVGSNLVAESCDAGATDTAGCDGSGAGTANACTGVFCGDGYVNTVAGETCDSAVDTAACDGPAAGLNACTARICGDGHDSTAAGVEACDDGNTVNTDLCLNACTIATCGDTAVCSAGACTSGPGGFPEQCDPGSTNNSATCDGTAGGAGQQCSFVVCGDSYVNGAAGETCDASGGANTSTCDGASAPAGQKCTARVCGDGAFNSAGGLEDCDDGNVSNNDPCLNTCDIAACNDGFVCSAGTCNTIVKPYIGPEVCDDGNLLNTDGCRTNCVSSDCGDGIVQVGEQCDDGDATCTAGVDTGDVCGTDNDCRGSCSLLVPNPGAPCTDATVVADCGAGSVAADCGWVAGFCTNAPDNRDDVATACRTSCLLPYCGDGLVNGTEQCDDGDLNNNDGCVIVAIGGAVNTTNTAAKNCGFNLCGDGKTCTDGASCPAVPSGGIEECDDGNTTNTDACVITTVGASPNFTDTPAKNCGLNDCGDTFVKAGSEQCDPGAGSLSNVLPDFCRLTCQRASCGDGVNDGAASASPGNLAAESCDTGVSNSNNAPCTATCGTAVCGDALTCSAPTCTSGSGGPEQCDDGNLFCIGGTVPTGTPCNPAGANPTDCGTGGLCQSDGDGCTGPATSTPAVCQNEGCGNGVTNLSEKVPGRCEDGNLVPGDGCDGECYDEDCVNGREGFNCTIASGPNAPFGDFVFGLPCFLEQCDDGNTNALDACNLTCVDNVCGDFVVNNGEDCDDPDAIDTDRCKDCVWAFCGDGTVCNVGGGPTQCGLSADLNIAIGVEQCDSSSGADTATCNGATAAADACRTSVCGDGYANAVDGEECDDGVNNGGADECRLLCIAPDCGDGTTDPGLGEQCDDGTTGSVNCTGDCCETGNDSYINSFAGYGCQDLVLSGCSTASCGNFGSKIDKLVTKANTLVGKAQALTAINKLPQASRKARSAGKRLAKASQLAANGCVNPSLDCLLANLDTLRQVALELEANLLGNNP